MTPYSTIYDVFLSQISDLEFLQVDTDDELKKRYLLNAVPKFKRCKLNLSDRDDTTGQFNHSLNDEEIIILGSLMVIEYLNPKINSTQLIRQAMSTRDFNLTSQANHLKQLLDLRTDKKSEVDKLIVDYTYNNNDMSGFK